MLILGLIEIFAHFGKDEFQGTYGGYFIYKIHLEAKKGFGTFHTLEIAQMCVWLMRPTKLDNFIFFFKKKRLSTFGALYVKKESRRRKRKMHAKKGYLKVLKWQPAQCFVSKSGS